MEGHFSASNWISRDKGWKLFLLPVQRPSHSLQTQTQANGRASNSLTRIMSSEERFKDSRASAQLIGVRKDKSVDQNVNVWIKLLAFEDGGNILQNDQTLLNFKNVKYLIENKNSKQKLQVVFGFSGDDDTIDTFISYMYWLEQ